MSLAGKDINQSADLGYLFEYLGYKCRCYFHADKLIMIFFGIN